MAEDVQHCVISVGPNQLGIQAAPGLLVQIRAALHQSGTIQVDLQGARRVHTAVLQVLVAGSIACQQHNRSLEVCGVPPQLATFLRLTRLSDFLSIHEQDSVEVSE